MPALTPVLSWIEASRVATTIAQSSMLTGFLSAVHLVGLTLVGGAAVVSGLRLTGLVLRDQPLAQMAGPARGIGVGLAVSVLTGLLLFSARAPAFAANGFFQLKMLVLATAAIAHVAWYRPAILRDRGTPLGRTATGATGLALWFGVILAGCALILFE